MSRGREEAILASVVDGTVPAAAAGGGATGVGGVADAADEASADARGAACVDVVGSRWNSTKLTVCGSPPSSVTVKSFAVSPSIGGGASNAAINRDLILLKRMCTLAMQASKLTVRP
jgi:hypothetical protein